MKPVIHQGRRSRQGFHLGRPAWTLCDQALSSLTNFLLGVVIARNFEPASFGAFGVAFTTYLLLMNVSRALCTDALVVRFSGDEQEAHGAAAPATGAVIVFGASVAACCYLVGAVIGGAVGLALRMVALVLPGLLLQDAWRFVFFAMGRPAAAAFNDLVWAVVQFGGLSWLVIADGAGLSLSTAVLVWGGAANVAAVIGCAQAAALPAPFQAGRWWRQHLDLWPVYLGEFVSRMGAFQLTLYLLAAVAGVTALGSVRAAELLLGPINVVFMGIVSVGVPEGVRLRATSPAAFGTALKWSSIVMAVAAITWGVVVTALPMDFRRLLLGATASGATPVVIPMALSLAALGATIGPVVGLRVLEKSRQSLRIRLVMAPLVLLAGGIGAMVAGATGAVVGVAVVNWFGVGLWWQQLSRAVDATGGATPNASGVLQVSSAHRRMA